MQGLLESVDNGPQFSWGGFLFNPAIQIFREDLSASRNLAAYQKPLGSFLKIPAKPEPHPSPTEPRIFGGGGWARAVLKSSPDDSNVQSGVESHWTL